MKDQFTLRDLFWLALVVVMAFVWWIDHRHWVGIVARQEQGLRDAEFAANKMYEVNQSLRRLIEKEREKTKEQ